YTDLLSEEPTLDGRPSRDPDRRATRAAWHEAAIGQIERLDRLVDSILASVRRIDETPPELVPVDVQATLSEIVDGLRPLLRQHAVDVRTGMRLFALADPPRLRQIVEHLLENAVKYAPPGTAIAVESQLVEGSVRIAVADQGPGIPPEWRERIFEPYARRDTHTARGSGIGLFAAKRLAESIGAHLWCEPVDPHVPDRTGARFVIALPAAVAV
ncbi:MAG TPA: HAMP domain-containing sensor histidine kinase, partial [Candidatus Limnocylindrales bacterium]